MGATLNYLPIGMKFGIGNVTNYFSEISVYIPKLGSDFGIGNLISDSNFGTSAKNEKESKFAKKKEL